MNRPWMPFYPNDFRLDTLDLSAEEVGVYMVLICLAWKSGEGSVTADLNELKRTLQRCISAFHGHTFNRIVPKILDRYFQKRRGKWFQKRVVKELQKARKLSAKQSQNAIKRWSADNKNNELPDANADAKPMPLQSQSQSQRKEDYPADAGSSNSPSVGYAFEQGVIRLRKKDFDNWTIAFAHLDLRAELIGLEPWAAQQRNWFVAVSQALAKKNREAKISIEKAKTQPYRWNGIEGVT